MSGDAELLSSMPVGPGPFSGYGWEVTAWTDQAGRVWRRLPECDGFVCCHGKRVMGNWTFLAGKRGPLTASEIDRPWNLLEEYAALRSRVTLLEAEVEHWKREPS